MSAISLPLFIGLAAAVLLLSSAALISLLLHRRCRRGESDLESGLPTARVAAVPNGKEPPAKGGDEQLCHFSWSDVESLTGNFAPAALIGEGGFSTVYLARLPDASLAAVKVYRGSAASERLHRAFRQELEILRRLHHPHVVRLLGYCDAGEGALVFEHVPNGSLDARLHGSGGDEAGAALPWAARASVAYGVARALEYLHEVCDPPVVHGDVSAANVLLDGRLEPRVCDFGCASAGFSGAVRPSARAVITGSPGYVDPHYLLTGVASKKGDVYGFGVLLLELLTGAEAFCAESGRSLAAAAGTGLLVDPLLGGEYDAGEAAALVALAARCVGEQPSLRPSMDEVVKFMAENVPSVLISAVDGQSNGKGSL